MKVLFQVLLFLLFLSSCCGQSKRKEEIQGNDLLFIISVPGGTRAHIITINSNYELCYQVGSYNSDGKLDSIIIKYNTEYEPILNSLSEIDVEILKSFYANKNQYYLNDTTIIKDAWEYRLYMNGDRIISGNTHNFDDYPDIIKDFIMFILYKAGVLYEIPGMS
ncbi:MAG: hypothetical protein IJK73_02915 [Bacteroidales bacterium]|nr:hypothetical protein [Bacteroidales bacterium]MBQ9877848.1 hypothetical protein [Bacteroidales bacterium]